MLRECFAEPAPKEVHGMMDGLSVHYYCGAEKGPHKGSATDFSEDEYWYTMNRALGMDELIYRHGAIMDQYDPDKKIGMMVDEWGCWHDVEPGTNPGFLYQQNTIRDAISAMMMFHFFHEHCDRVHMANIAQMVNVLQAMVLTEGEKMVLTPTYYVFKMMKPHMDAENIDTDVTCDGKEVNGRVVPKISMSASEKNEKLTISICNTSLDDSEDVEIEIRDAEYKSVSGEVMAAQNMCDYNDFDEEEKLHPTELKAELNNGTIKVTLPKMSVAVLTVE